MKKARKNRDRAALNSPLIRRPIQKCFWLFLLPTFAAFCIGFLYPFCKGFFLSFCDFKTTKNWTWVGIKNYIAAFQDKSFGHAFWYTALFAVVSLVLINVIAFAAMGIDKAKARAGKWRIAESTLFALAALGGALGGTLGMRAFHHKTKHKEFRFGFPALLCLQCAAVVYLILIWKQVI